MKWKKTRVPDNRSKPLEMWSCDGYTVAQNLNRGDHWAFEVMHAGRYIGEARDLEAAKRVALNHYVSTAED